MCRKVKEHTCDIITHTSSNRPALISSRPRQRHHTHQHHHHHDHHRHQHWHSHHHLHKHIVIICCVCQMSIALVYHTPKRSAHLMVIRVSCLCTRTHTHATHASHATHAQKLGFSRLHVAHTEKNTQTAYNDHIYIQQRTLRLLIIHVHIHARKISVHTVFYAINHTHAHAVLRR